jgi:hypothetical protein
VKLAAKMSGIVAIAMMTTLVSGCKTAPQLTQAGALSMIQAKYDQAPPEPFNIVLNDSGMQQGVSDKLWAGIKKYPNGYWGDFKLTGEGKKEVKLADGKDVIQWRPDGPDDLRYSYSLATVALNRLKARVLGEVQDVGPTKVISFYEDVALNVSPSLSTIVHNPGNSLSTRRQATFVLDNGAWKLQSIE